MVPSRAVVRAPIVLLALSSLGCARNAILEIELTVPALPTGAPERFAVAQFETGEVTFEEEWERTVEHEGTALTDAPQTIAYSVVADEEHPVVLVKVLFCTTPDCTALADAADRAPAVWYRLEHPLYIGERTTWQHTIDVLPTDPPPDAIDVDKCEIEGCITAGTSDTTYCRLSGAHYCE